MAMLPAAATEPGLWATGLMLEVMMCRIVGSDGRFCSDQALQLPQHAQHATQESAWWAQPAQSACMPLTSLPPD